jgi:hypothetical protein
MYSSTGFYRVISCPCSVHFRRIINETLLHLNEENVRAKLKASFTKVHDSNLVVDKITGLLVLSIQWKWFIHLQHRLVSLPARQQASHLADPGSWNAVTYPPSCHNRLLFKKLTVTQLVKKCCILCNSKSHYCIHKNLQLVPTISQMNPAHNLQFYFPKICFNMILS